MKPILSAVAVLATALSMTACTTTEQAVGVGALAGGVVGGVASGTLAGAAVGATLGGVGGAIVGSTLLGRYAQDTTQCVYEDQRGRRYLAPCG